MRPRLLDLFCGAGGCSVGYARAGFDVVGVDNRPQSHYPYEFHQADALKVLSTWDLTGYDAIHASPPCQAFTRAKHLRDAQGRASTSGDLLTPTLERLAALDTPWVVENVPGAPVPNPLTLCGSSFGLAVRRHRHFGSPLLLMGLPCDHHAQGRPVGVYHVMNDHVPQGGTTARNLQEGQAAMGIDWMTWPELKEAIPPAYTTHVGQQLLTHLQEPP